MNDITRKIGRWLSRREGLSTSVDLRPYGLRPREWTGKLQSRRKLAPRELPDRRSVQDFRRDLQEH